MTAPTKPKSTQETKTEAEYVPLAVRYRPQRFIDLAGQTLIAATLRNAVLQNRIHNVYLLCGPRGCGKTSAARILAKAANCGKLNDGEPCLRCPSCVAAEAGRHFDIHEFDAASHRKVEDAEELLKKVPAHPLRADSRFKFFIVDEVHMMSQTAFNALLKTLEEPPRWVRFILATTEPEALPDTIVSRCLRFDLRTVPRASAVQYLERVAQAEKITASPQLLEGLLRRARGGMRDALQLIDQMVCLCGKTLDPKLVAKALGVSGRAVSMRLLRAVGNGSFKEVLEAVEVAVAEGHSAETIVEKTIETARDLMVLETLGVEMAARLAEDPEGVHDLLPLTELLPEEHLLHILTHLSELEKRLKQAKNDRILLEVTFLKLARVRELLPLGEALERIRRMEETMKESHGTPGVPATASRG